MPLPKLKFASKQEETLWEHLWHRISAAPSAEEPKPFYVRVSTARGFSFLPLDGAAPLLSSGERQLAQKTSRIPPAWRNVIITPNNEKYIGRGVHTQKKDGSVHLVHSYQPSRLQYRSAKKHCDLLYFAREVHGIESACHHKLQELESQRQLESKEAIICTVVLVLIDCAFRIGSQRPSKRDANRGIFYITREHVQLRTHDEVAIAFRGKWGKDNQCTLHDKLLARVFAQLLSNAKGHAFVFQNAKTASASPSDVRSFLKDYARKHNIGAEHHEIFSPKSFRNVAVHVRLFHDVRPWIMKKQPVEKRAELIRAAIRANAALAFHSAKVQTDHYLNAGILKILINHDPRIDRIFEENDDMLNVYVALLELLCGKTGANRAARGGA
jgi:DNA topoisomerase IB